MLYEGKKLKRKKHPPGFSNILVNSPDLSVFISRLGSILTDASANLKEVAGKPQK